jgi:hypothetical protein
MDYGQVASRQEPSAVGEALANAGASLFPLRYNR